MAKRQSNDEKSRAEQIRARRQQSRKGSQKNIFGNSVTRKRTTYQAPVTRRKMSTPPVIKRKKNKVHVPLNRKGAELHLPALSRLQLGWRLVSGAIFFLSLAVVFSFSSLSAFRVDAVNLEGAQRLDPQTILANLDVQGQSIIKLQPKEIADEIQNRFPGLNGVRVSVGLPASVNIKVVERQPLILWQQTDQSLWIDAEGVMFPVRGEAEVTLTVMASGDPPQAKPAEAEVETEEESSEEVVNELESIEIEEVGFPTTPLAFVKTLLSIRDYVPEESFLQYDPQFGLSWQDPGGWMVYFGRDTEQIDIKLAEYNTILAALREKDLTPALISVEYLYAPFYRLEQ
jgi:cell division septal protein FtsQ